MYKFHLFRIEFKKYKQNRFYLNIRIILILKEHFQVWGCDIIVDWADPQEEPDEQTMSKVKVLYVRNLTQDVTEEKLKVGFLGFYILK